MRGDGGEPGAACDGHVLFTATDPALGTELFAIATPGAMTTRLGLGGRPGQPSLVMRDGAAPILGSAITVLGTGPSAHAGFLLAGPSALPAPPLAGVMQGGSDWVGVLRGVAIVITASPQPTFSVPLKVPNVAALEGGALNLQGVWVDLAAVPPVQLGNGLQLVVGSAAAH